MQLQLLGSCGTADAAAEWSITTDDLALNPSNSGDSTNAYELGTALTGIAGDTYVVCWGHDPQAPEDYNVEVDGDAALTGPLVGDRQCTMGVDCQIFLEGHGLESTNAVVILSEGSCGSTDAVVDWVATQTWTAVRTCTDCADSDGNAYPVGPWYDLGRPTFGLAGGGYKLCWGSNPRTVAAPTMAVSRVGPAHQNVTMALEDFNVEIDTDFGLVGPFRGNFSCDLGAVCEVSIDGWGLTDINKIVIVTGGECGDSFGYGQPNTLSPASLGYAAQTISEAADEADFRLGTALSAVGNFYKLCWSYDPEPPNFPLNLYNYNVEIDPNFIIQFPEGGGWDFGRRMGDGGPWRGLLGNETVELALAPKPTDETKFRL